MLKLGIIGLSEGNGHPYSWSSIINGGFDEATMADCGYAGIPIYLTANKDTFEKMRDNIDLDFSEVLEGRRSLEEVGNEVLEEVVRIANGKRTRAEVYGFGFTETVMSRVCDYV